MSEGTYPAARILRQFAVPVAFTVVGLALTAWAYTVPPVCLASSSGGPCAPDARLPPAAMGGVMLVLLFGLLVVLRARKRAPLRPSVVIVLTILLGLAMVAAPYFTLLTPGFAGP